MVKQISVFMQNEPGRISKATRVVGDAGINLRAIVVADTETYGLLRFIADDTDHATAVLKEAGFTVKVTEVVAAEVPDVPGGLARVMEALTDNNTNVGYMYAFFNKNHDKAVVIIRVDDPVASAQCLEKAGIKTLSKDDIK